MTVVSDWPARIDGLEGMLDESDSAGPTPGRGLVRFYRASRERQGNHVQP